jgi:hypothetical protein|tara:strand:+ start:355 stop:552 length:198 start_codon:yes stop_codon:yes gene_type:complete
MENITNVYVTTFSGGWASFLIGLTIAMVIAICMDHTNLSNREQLFWGVILWLLSPLLFSLIKLLF